MQKVLIANQNIEKNNILCQHLAKDKRLEIIGTFAGMDTLDKYLETKPNILILDTEFEDINFIEIINKLSTNLHEKRNCNIILTTYKEKHFNLYNTARVYGTIYYDDENYLNKLSEIVNELYIYDEYEELTDEELDLFFLELRLPLNSSGYIREGIHECYYYPDVQKKLKYIFTVIGEKHRKSIPAVRSCFRTELKRLNMYKYSIKCPIMKYFDLTQNITPKEFLGIAVMYLHQQKGKKK